MGPTSTTLSEWEQRFQEVLADYLEEQEAGRAGDLQALLLGHPDLAEEITAFFAHQEQVAYLARPLRVLAGEARVVKVARPAPSPALSGISGFGGAKFFVKITGIVIKRGDRMDAHQVQEIGDRDPRQLGRLAIAQSPLTDLFKEPERPHLLGYRQRLPGVMT